MMPNLAFEFRGSRAKMIDVTRREAMAGAAALGALGGASLASAQTAADGAQWDLSEIYPTEAAWETERQAILKAIPTLGSLKGRLGESAATLKAAMQAQSDLNKRASRLYTYASLKADEDLRVAPNQERKSRRRTCSPRSARPRPGAAPEDRRARRGQGERIHRRRPRPRQVRASSFAIRCAPAPHTLSPAEEQLLAAAGIAAFRAAATSATSSPRRTFRGRPSSSATAAKSGSTIRAIRSSAARPTAPTARWSSTRSGRATRRSKVRWARRSRPRSTATSSHAKARKYRQRAAGRARWQQPARGRLSHADRRDQPRAAVAAPLFRASPADARPARHGLLGHLSAAGEVDRSYHAGRDARS